MVDGGVLAQWAAVGLLAASQALYILRRRNGRVAEDTEERTEVNSELKHINGKLDTMSSDIKDIKKSGEDQRLHCANVSGELAGKIKAVEAIQKRSKK